MGSLHKQHGVFLHHVGYVPRKACCTLHAAHFQVAFWLDLNVTDLGREIIAFSLAEGEGRIIWDHLAGNIQSGSNTFHGPVMTDCCLESSVNGKADGI